MINNRKNTLNTIVKLPFPLQYKKMVGGKPQYEQRKEISFLELRGIVNIFSIMSKNEAKVNDVLNIKLSSPHAGIFYIAVSKEQYEVLSSLMQDAEKSFSDDYEEEMDA